MKSLSFKELGIIAGETKTFQGFEVYDAVFNDGVLVLGLRKGGVTASFIIDVGSQKPVFLATREAPPNLKKQIKPLILFLRAHLLGKKFREAMSRPEFGRLVSLFFEGRDGSDLEMELHLFPQARNIIAKAGQGKNQSSISINKIKALQELKVSHADEDPRSTAEIYADWMAFRKGGKLAAKDNNEGGAEVRARASLKKQQGHDALKSKLEDLKSEPWRELGDWLSAHRDLDVPPELRKWLEPKKSLQENIDRAFDKAKQIKKKSEAIVDRMADLQKDIDGLAAGGPVAPVKSKSAPSPLVDAKGRTRNFDDGTAAYIGKSAADNLKILRRAKSWYIWVHPKDIPGAHAVIALEKNAKLPEKILRQVALWTLQESLSPKQWKDWQGIKCEFLYCQCRFVTPIKGDKLGRVNYKNEKVLTLIVQDSAS